MTENSLKIKEIIHISDLRDIQYNINMLIDFRGYESIILDFSETKKAFAECMVPMCSFILLKRNERIRFKLILPKFDRLRRLFLNCGLAHIIDPRRFREYPEPSPYNIPATIFSEYKKQQELVNDCVNRILKRSPKLNRKNMQALEWSVNEICDNVLNHSESPIGGLFQMNFRNFVKEVEFIVADAGIGIPNSLRSISNKRWTDEYALEQSIRQGITRDPEFGQGNGLYGTFQMAVLSGGTFHINSGNAHLVTTRKREVQVRHDARQFTGSLVVCALKFSSEDLLAKALAFKGSGYQMVDFIELAHEQDNGSILFKMGSETASFGSRSSGFEIRRKINNLIISSGGASVVCDMSGVDMMSSSFADEVFGKMAREFGIGIFKDRINIKNLSDTNNMLITKAISQRLAERRV
ncbi:hypothetical protein GOX01_08260 [Gluconobacter oxydans]|uniref:DUF4325 domain-containing protein n=1 Tax=Gluconobacter oxydans TaxID=442 RepID=A0AB35AM85_GLUOY|nr:STAS-like domain-containing protein [Gluconobacter oxydans]MBF0856023.1 DUF4325 domain-containing protein [Gluconobacter oxydans]TCW27543.1 uncharacterized protein DUF4325 [Gluconobacter oxydans]GEC60495.1 hypothetical protein GOX01_08260 [Gluconobacter oxydans]